MNKLKKTLSILISIGGRKSVWGISETDLLATGVQNGVKPLHEYRAADKIHPRHGFSEALHDQVKTVIRAAYGAVQRAGPDLGVRA